MSLTDVKIRVYYTDEHGDEYRVNLSYEDGNEKDTLTVKCDVESCEDISSIRKESPYAVVDDLKRHFHWALGVANAARLKREGDEK